MCTSLLLALVLLSENQMLKREFELMFRVRFIIIHLSSPLMFLSESRRKVVVHILPMHGHCEKREAAQLLESLGAGQVPLLFSISSRFLVIITARKKDIKPLPHILLHNPYCIGIWNGSNRLLNSSEERKGKDVCGR